MGNMVFCSLIVVATVNWTNSILGVIKCPTDYKPVLKGGSICVPAVTNNTVVGTYTPILCIINPSSEYQIMFDFSNLPNQQINAGSFIWCQISYRYK